MDLYITRAKKLKKILTSKKLFTALFRFGVFAGVEHSPILTNDLRTIVDIGANKGQFTLACRKWSPYAKVFAFEPLEKPLKIFKDLFYGDSDVHIDQVAIGPTIDKLSIHVSKREDSSSLLPIGPNQVKYFPGSQEKEIIMASVVPLSQVLPENDINAPAMLKIDVQGFEFEVLMGCESMLDKFDYIYCECSFIELYEGQKIASKIIEWLAKRNFQFTGIYNIYNAKNGLPIQADFYFKKT